MESKNRKNILLVVGGIVIGVALTTLAMNVVNSGDNNARKQIASNATSAEIQPAGEHIQPAAAHAKPVAQAQPAATRPAAAVAAETHHAIGAAPVAQSMPTNLQPPQSAAAPHATPSATEKHPHDWVTPADLAPKTNAGATASAPAGPQYKSSHQTFYVYGGDGAIPATSALPSALPTAIQAPASNQQVQIIGLPGQPQTVITTETTYSYTGCVDPPSVTRGRAYRAPTRQ